MSEYCTTEELAAHFALAVPTIRHWVKLGHIPESTYMKVGNTYRFNLRKVEAALLNEPDTKSVIDKVEEPTEVEEAERVKVSVSGIADGTEDPDQQYINNPSLDDNI